MSMPLAMTPIVAPLDLHTNLSDEMIDYADALVGYREYPHTDMAEAGERALLALRTGVTKAACRNHRPRGGPRGDRTHNPRIKSSQKTLF